MNERTDVSYLIEQFIVEPKVAGLRKALREMSDGYATSRISASPVAWKNMSRSLSPRPVG